jgi:aconitase B|tara:strand:+ start:254 stop:415 length:162 start_codon:yes stop_codon:yes gene_type:complete
VKRKSILTSSQEKQMKKHKDHHSKKHMDMMRDLMGKGSSFKSAHNKAMKEVGK